MTNQQKYVELLAKWKLLGVDIENIAKVRTELREEMSTIPFPDSFYYRVVDQVLFRTYKDQVIQVRTFDK